MKKLALCAMLAILITLTARADELLLKNGNLINGEIISKDAKVIRIRIPYTDQVTGKKGSMEMAFSTSQVRTVTRTGTLFSKTNRTRVDSVKKPAAAAKINEKKKDVKVDWDYRLDLPPEFVKAWKGDDVQLAKLSDHQAYLEQEKEKIIAQKRKLKDEMDKIPGAAFGDEKIDDEAMLELNLFDYYDSDAWDSAAGKKIRPLVRDVEKRKLLIFKWTEKFKELVQKAEEAKKAEEKKNLPPKTSEKKEEERKAKETYDKAEEKVDAKNDPYQNPDE